MNNYLDYFARQTLLWGEAKQKALQEKSVLLVGCGGLGCSVGIALGSSGIGKMVLIDFDKVSLHNLHRQIAFESNDVGMYKCEVLKTKIEKRCKYIEVKTIKKPFDAKLINEKFDIIVDATDNLKSRVEIDRFAKKTNTPWIYGSVEEFNAQVCFFEKSSFGAFSDGETNIKGITAPMVMHVASFESMLALRYLVGLSVNKDLLYYIYIDNKGELITKKFNMPKVENEKE